MKYASSKIIKSLLPILILVFLILPAPTHATNYLIIQGAVRDCATNTSVPDGYTVQVTNITKSIASDAVSTFEGSYTCIISDLFSDVAATGDELEFLVKDDQGITVEVSPSAYTVADLDIADGSITSFDLYHGDAGYTINLWKGLNMVGLPLKPKEGYTAYDLCQDTDANFIIRLTYNESTGKMEFKGFSPSVGNPGYEITGNSGYIVNTTGAGSFKVTGDNWPSEHESLSAKKGLNMMTLPKRPSLTMQAYDMVEKCSGNFIIRLDYDEEQGKPVFKGFSPNASNQGYDLEGGQGYIVNLTSSQTVDLSDGESWISPGAEKVTGETIEAATGGTINIGDAQVEIPPEALEEDIMVTVEVPSIDPTVSGDMEVVGKGIEITYGPSGGGVTPQSIGKAKDRVFKERVELTAGESVTSYPTITLTCPRHDIDPNCITVVRKGYLKIDDRIDRRAEIFINPIRETSVSKSLGKNITTSVRNLTFSVPAIHDQDIPSGEKVKYYLAAWDDSKEYSSKVTLKSTRIYGDKWYIEKDGQDPIGDRTPIILIHGIQPDEDLDKNDDEAL